MESESQAKTPEAADPERGWRVLLRPASVGALYFGALSAVALFSTLTDDRVQGVSAPSVRHLIATRFAGEIVDSGLLALALALLFGIALGALAGGLVRARDNLRGAAARRPSELALPALGVLFAGHGLLWLYDVAKHPQAYAPALYARGGPHAVLQVFVTDWLGPHGVVLLAVICLAVWLVPPLVVAVRAGRGRKLLRLSAASLTVLGLVWALPLVGRGLAPHVARAAGNRPNVLILAADSLRADRIEARVAPEMTRVADGAARFDHAYVSVPRTFPSWVSTLTGRDPHHHGIRNMFPRWEERAADVAPIPRSFARAGYHTAVVSDFAGDIFRRMDLGFARTRTPTFDMRELVREVVIGGQGPLLPLLRTRAAYRTLPVLRELHDTTDPDVVTSDTLDEIDRAGPEPFFVVAFYSTTHFPYAAPAPHWSRFVDKSYRGPYRYGKTPAIFAEHKPDESDVKAVRALYDGAVSAVDDAMGEVLRGLAARGLDKNTIVVITADHGESLYEPGRGQGHGDHLFGDEAVRVPLVIADPTHPGAKQIPDLVRSIDLAPTLCELAEVSCAPAMDGRSLVPALGGKPLAPRPAFAETGIWFTRQIPDVPPSLRLPYPDLTEVLEVDAAHEGDLVVKREFESLLVTAKHRMVRDGHYKLVYAPSREGVKWLLFDTELDPGETRDVAKEHPEVVQKLEAELWEWMLEDRGMERRGDFFVGKKADGPPGGTPP